VARLEGLQPPQRLHERLLYEIVGIAEIARPPRQPTSGPASQSREITLEESVQRLLIALARPLKQVERRGNVPLIHSKDGRSGMPSLQMICRSSAHTYPDVAF
jgi:hypothetical protein